LSDVGDKHDKGWVKNFINQYAKNTDVERYAWEFLKVFSELADQGYVSDDPVYEKCEVSGCLGYVEYEGWWQVTDFTGNKTGMIQKRKVCKDHVGVLKGIVQ
jgi:hypothetical protein